jgi:hypothetical protein
MFKNVAYAKLKLDFDHYLFSLEYDKLIFPKGKPINNSKMSWETTRKLNQKWGMVPPETYDKCSVETDYNQHEDRGLPQWRMVQLMCLETNDSDSDIIKKEVTYGGTFARNMTLHRDWKIKPEFENLKIVKFIKSLPIKQICSIHCVSLEPGSFASIHRDSRWFPEAGKENTVIKNGVCQQGFTVITLNISDGGGPLYWALDNQYDDVKFANDPVYMCSDYFVHGVPVCTSRRRQVRVTAMPDEGFGDLVDRQTEVLVPPDIVWAGKGTWYPG